MKQITSRDNPACKQLKKLAESSRERRKTGKTLLDGAHLLASYLEAGAVPVLVAVTPEARDKAEIRELLDKAAGAQQIELAPHLLADIAPVETPTGLLAVVDIPHAAPPARPDFCLLVEDIQDPGNLGTILRSAAAAGVQVVYLSPHCADPWSPKVLRGGMGAHFALVLQERANLSEIAAGFAGLTVAASLDADRSLYELDLTGPVAFMVGNEGAGLSAELLGAAGQRIRIPMPGRMESLNAAAAASICLFERVRQRAVNR
jgi:TrmH family RNA methyltransferase